MVFQDTKKKYYKACGDQSAVSRGDRKTDISTTFLFDSNKKLLSASAHGLSIVHLPSEHSPSLGHSLKNTVAFRYCQIMGQFK